MGTNVRSGTRMLLLYISAQMSYPPSMHRFLVESAQRVVRYIAAYIPEGTQSLYDDFFLAVRETRDQRTDDILALQQSSRRRIVLNEIRYGDTGPFALRGVCAFHLPGNRNPKSSGTSNH